MSCQADSLEPLGEECFCRPCLDKMCEYKRLGEYPYKYFLPSSRIYSRRMNKIIPKNYLCLSTYDCKQVSFDVHYNNNIYYFILKKLLCNNIGFISDITKYIFKIYTYVIYW